MDDAHDVAGSHLESSPDHSSQTNHADTGQSAQEPQVQEHSDGHATPGGGDHSDGPGQSLQPDATQAGDPGSASATHTLGSGQSGDGHAADSGNNTAVAHEGAHEGVKDLQQHNQDKATHNTVDAHTNSKDSGHNKESASVFGHIVELVKEIAHIGGSDIKDSGHDSKDLVHAAQQGYTAHPHYCNLSVAEAAKEMNVHGLANLSANAQFNYMQSHWTQVSPYTAHAMANSGHFVVAGFNNPSGHGHVAVVTPGPGGYSHGSFSPNVTGGGSPAGQSDGSLHAGQVFGHHPVTYFSAPR